MNKTKIDWADYTWNPVSGCLHGCPYCYAKKTTTRFSVDARLNLAAAERWNGQDGLYVLREPFKTSGPRSRILIYPYAFAPTLHLYRMDWPGKLKRGANVFVCSMADLFGEWVPDEWITTVFDACKEYPQNNYLFLTKNPGRYLELAEKGLLPKAENHWYGTSVPTQDTQYFFAEGYNTFLSIEPLHGPFDADGHNPIMTDWVIIGAETGNRRGKVTPKVEWVNNIVTECQKAKIPVFMKGSLSELMGDGFIQQTPEALLPKPKLSKKQKDRLEMPCGFCKEIHMKREMNGIYVRRANKKSPQSAGCLCNKCYREFSKMMGFEEET